jgi:hypothetical protein
MTRLRLINGHDAAARQVRRRHVPAERPDGGRPALDRGLAGARAAGHSGVVAQLSALASIAATLAGDDDAAQKLPAEAEVSADQRDELGAALVRFGEGLQIARQLDDRVAQCYHLGGLGCCLAGTGQPKFGRPAVRGNGNLERPDRR